MVSDTRDGPGTVGVHGGADPERTAQVPARSGPGGAHKTQPREELISMHKLLRRAGIIISLLALAAGAALGGQAAATPQSPSGAAAKAAGTATAATAAGGLRVVA